MTRQRIVLSYAVAFAALSIGDRSLAQSPFATRVVEYDPAPGQFVQDSAFNDPRSALGPPTGGGTLTVDNDSKATLGGFGGSIVLGFDHTVADDPANPMGLDAIVFGNAFWVGSSNRHWAECGYIEISRDDNGNNMPDDAWYLIPGSHITNPAGQLETQTWDNNIGDPTYPPDNPAWLPITSPDQWQTQAIRLPGEIFDALIVTNPNGLFADSAGIFGYADFSPTLELGDMDGDNFVDDPTITPKEFYTVPDDPLTTGITPGSGGGDAFDIAWAIDPDTLAPADLDGFDFIRITNGVNRIDLRFGEASPEIDAVADVAPMSPGDTDGDGDVDLDDFSVFAACAAAPTQSTLTEICVLTDLDHDNVVDTTDFGLLQRVFTGAKP